LSALPKRWISAVTHASPIKSLPANRTGLMGLQEFSGVQEFSRNFLRLVGPAVAAVVGEWRRSGNADHGDQRGGSHRFGNDQAAWRFGLEDR